MSDYETIKFELKGRVATITFNRPDAANGLNAKMASSSLIVQGNVNLTPIFAL